MTVVRETELDLRALSAALWRKAWLLLLLSGVAAGLTYLALSFVDPLYRADTRILIESRESPLTRPRDTTADTTERYDESAIQSQVEVLRSREIADAVIDKLGLTRRRDFDPATAPSLLDSVLVLVGMRKHPVEATIRERVTEIYFERLSVFPLAKSRVIGVEFEAPDPKLAADVANAIADSFVALQKKARNDTTAAATVWLQQEIERLRSRVAEAEAAVAQYRSGAGLFDVRGSDGTLSTQQLSEINAELARAKAARSEAEARAQQVRHLLESGGSLESSQEVLNSQLIQRLRESQVTLQTQIAELSTTLLPAHPRIQALRTQIANLDTQIRQEAGKVLSSLETAARVAAAREASLANSLNEAKANSASTGEKEIELRALEREATAQRELLESFLARYREAVARSDPDYAPADARIISRAVPPREPSWPKKGLLSLLVGLTVLLLSAAVVLLREFGSGRAFRIVDASPEETAMPLPAPLFDAPAPAVAARSAAAADRPGTNALAEILANPAVRTALFTGAEGGEGAGDIALAAARILATQNLRPVLLDIGVEPSPALGGGSGPGLGDLLAGAAAFGEVIRRDDGSRVHYIPLGSTDDDPPLQRLTLVIGALTHTYDKVMIVAAKMADWPSDHLRPDLAAVVCPAAMSEAERHQLYRTVIERGARSALIVRLDADSDESEAETVAA